MLAVTSGSSLLQPGNKRSIFLGTFDPGQSFVGTVNLKINGEALEREDFLNPVCPFDKREPRALKHFFNPKLEKLIGVPQPIDVKVINHSRPVVDMAQYISRTCYVSGVNATSGSDRLDETGLARS